MAVTEKQRRSCNTLQNALELLNVQCPPKPAKDVDSVSEATTLPLLGCI